MREARELSNWDQTASLMALLVNINSAKHARKMTAIDFHPYRKNERRKPDAEGEITNLKMLLRGDPDG